MNKLFKFLFLAIFLSGIGFQSVNAYDIPQRKIEIKPYVNFFFPNNLWEKETETNLVDNKTSFGFGTKIRTQFISQFGIVLNASYQNFETLYDLSNEGVLFTGGAYYSRSINIGNITFDLSYGIIIAAEEVLGLLMPCLEYSRPVSDRMSLAIELGWPIPNDWPKSLDFNESYSSLTLSAGTIFVF